MQQDRIIVWCTHHCYFSVAAIPCDVYREVFPSGPELLGQYRKADHKVLRCSFPWCINYNEVKYSYDLRQHVRTHHPKEHDRAPSRLLATYNLIYFPNNPDILQEYENVAPYNSDVLQTAQSNTNPAHGLIKDFNPFAVADGENATSASWTRWLSIGSALFSFISQQYDMVPCELAEIDPQLAYTINWTYVHTTDPSKKATHSFARWATSTLQALLLPGSAIRPSTSPYVRLLETNYHMVHAIASEQFRSSLEIQIYTLDTFTSIDQDNTDDDIMQVINDDSDCELQIHQCPVPDHSRWQIFPYRLHSVLKILINTAIFIQLSYINIIN